MNAHNRIIRFVFVFIFTILILLIFYLINSKPINLNKSIQGQWHGISNEIEMNTIIYANNECVFSIENNSTGKITVIDGLCNIDFSKQPHPLDVTKTINGDLYSIVNFVNFDTIQIARFSKKWRLRPVSFNENDLILKRIKK